MKHKPIVVVGSINMDLVCRVPRRPRPGETVLGESLETVPGGKGANQAVAAARLGARVAMIGRVGNDPFGARLLDGLRRNRVDTAHVKTTRRVASGCAMIQVDAKGENSIVVAPGANYQLCPKDIDRARPLLRSAGMVLLQLEIPIETVLHVVELCRREGVPVLLDPAPVPVKGLPAPLFGVDIFSPNETEARQLIAAKGGATAAQGKKIAVRNPGAALLERGARLVVLKRGASGSEACSAAGWTLRVPAFRVPVVDTTAAGDAFTAAFAVACNEGMETDRALRFANAAGACCCMIPGAQPSLPVRRDVEALLSRQPRPRRASPPKSSSEKKRT